MLCVNMNEILRIICAKPLICKKDNILKLRRGNTICWAEFGEINKSKIKHVLFYFHGTPSCRFEPMLHSTLPKALNVNNHSNPTSSTDYSSNNSDNSTDQTNITDALNAYKQKGIRLICIERPGFGLTSYKDERNLDNFVDDVVEAIGSKEMNLFDNYNDDYNKINSDADGLIETALSDIKKTSIKNIDIYAMGFSAGGPYALSMRYLLQEKLNKVRLPCTLKGVAVIASSASIHDNSSYQKSMEGKILNIFFSLPVKIQGIFYSGGIYGIFVSLNVSIYALSGFRYTIGLFSNNGNKMSITDTIEKLKTIKYVLNNSYAKEGSRSVVKDTLILQSKTHPWGLNLTSKNEIPLLLYYSKNDYTVPYQTGIWLAGKTLGEGKEPVWLNGGHNCMFLNLNQILDDLINT
jgi:pimeloyl-ACP methyl ester carboxylesterase